MAVETALEIQPENGPALEGRLGQPSEEYPRAGLALCHPHPQYGGDMDNPVVVRAGEVARGRGLLTLRFNFRGVGSSRGAYDGGRGEQSDARAALGALRARLPPGRPLGLLGYSFGAWVSAQVAAGEAVAALCLVAPPLTMLDFGPLDGRRLHLLVAVGTRDPYCPLDALGSWLAGVPGAGQAVIEGADHFFFGKLYPLGTAVEQWLTTWAAR